MIVNLVIGERPTDSEVFEFEFKNRPFVGELLSPDAVNGHKVPFIITGIQHEKDGMLTVFIRED